MTAARLRDDRQGTALVFAVVFLFVFSLFGAAYMRFSFLEMEQSNAELGRIRAEQAAAAGVQAALSHLRVAEAGGQVDKMLGIEHLYTFPVYKQRAPLAAGAEPADLPASYGVDAVDDRAARASVVVSDESAKVNLNHAPASVLQTVLSVDGATARAVAASLPRAEGGSADAAAAGWLLSPQDLVERNLLTQEQAGQIDPALVTTLSVADHTQPGAHLNVGNAEPKVLAAVLNISLEEAESLSRRGPFKLMEQLAEASGKSPDTYNVVPGADGQSALTFQPNTFRVSSTGTYAYVTEAGGDAGTVTSRVEAVVRRNADGGLDVVYWHGARGQKDEAPAEAIDTPAEEAAAPEAQAQESPAEEGVETPADAGAEAPAQENATEDAAGAAESGSNTVS